MKIEKKIIKSVDSRRQWNGIFASQIEDITINHMRKLYSIKNNITIHNLKSRGLSRPIGSRQLTMKAGTKKILYFYYMTMKS